MALHDFLKNTGPVIVHTKPTFKCTEATVSDEGEINVKIEATDSTGAFNSLLSILIVSTKTDGSVIRKTIGTGGTGYVSFDISNVVNMDEVAFSYLSMKCNESKCEFGDVDDEYTFNRLESNGKKFSEEVILADRPIVIAVSNNKPYTNPLTNEIHEEISTEPRSITIDWLVDNNDGVVDRIGYQLNKNGNWIYKTVLGSPTSGTLTIENLQPGTEYTIDFTVHNTAGWANSEDEYSTTIRTRHLVPILTHLVPDGSTLNSVSFYWKSDKPIAKLVYGLNDGPTETKLFEEAISEGRITVNNIDGKYLEEDTSYKISVEATSIEELDYLTSVKTVANNKTQQAPLVMKINQCIFGEDITGIIRKEIPNKARMKVWFNYDTSNTFIFDLPEIMGSEVEFTLPLAGDIEKLDKIYKYYTDQNYIPISLQLVWEPDEGVDMPQGESTIFGTQVNPWYLNLRGKVLCSHVGIGEETKRAYVWMGDGLNTARRAVVWIGTKDGPKRTI